MYKSRTAICTRSSDLKTYPESISVKTQLLEGSLVELFDGPTVTKSKIKIYDFYQSYPELNHEFYFCAKKNLLTFQDEEFPEFIKSIKCHNERLKFIKNETQIKYIKELKVSEIVCADGLAFGVKWTYDCIVRYFGLVPAFGPGYYFILELLVIFLLFLVVSLKQ